MALAAPFAALVALGKKERPLSARHSVPDNCADQRPEPGSHDGQTVL
jgi:hypothetical protein